MEPIYLDNAATTPIRPEVWQVMSQCAQECFANPSSNHLLGRRARQRLQDARAQLADAMGCAPDQLLFTGSGTEANNIAMLGFSSQIHKPGKKHVLVSTIEHKSVLEVSARLREQGADVDYVPADSSGTITLDAVRSAVRDETSLVSIAWVNNELGTIQPIEQIGEFLRGRGIAFHIDAVQALGKRSFRLDALPVDLMTFSAHKIGGPKGVGALYIAPGIELQPHTLGGPQERGLRAGTENLPGIVGFAQAAKLAAFEQPETTQKVSQIQAQFEESLVSSLGGGVSILGSEARRSPYITNALFNGVDSNYLLRKLDGFGICATAGSACQSASFTPSHVLLAIGLSRDLARSAVRFSFSGTTTNQDLAYVVESIKTIRQNLGFSA